MLKTVLIRADGSNRIGLGHLTRTIDIALELRKKNYQITFLIKNFKEGISLLEEKKFKSIILNTIIQNSKNEIIEINTLLSKSNQLYDLILIDLQKRFVDQNYLDVFKKFCKKLMVLSDDPNPFYIDVDFVIAFGQNKDKFNHNKINNQKYYLGFKYFPLNKIYQNLEKKVVQKRVSNILLTFGGADPMNYSIRVLKVLKKLQLDIKITLIIGFAYPDDRFNSIINDLNKDIILKRDVKNMIDYLKEADLCICSGGNTLIEVLTCGVPCIVLPQTKIEDKRAEFFAKRNMISRLFLEFSDNELELWIKKMISNYSLRTSISKKAQENFDGKGLDRIFDIIVNFT